MNIGAFLRTIKTDLAGAFETPVKVVQLRLDQKKDYYFRVSDTTPYEGVNFGIDIDIQWRHVDISMSTAQDFVIESSIFDNFRYKVRDNTKAILEIVAELKKSGFFISFIVNSRSYDEFKTIPLNETWYSFSFKVKSKFLFAYDGLDIHYDNFKAPVLLVWSLVELLISDEILDSESDIVCIEEGAISDYRGIRYERNPINRLACIKAHGYVCAACGIDMEKVYGEAGKHVIEVHHIDPVSTYGGAREIDPVKDLVPLCPNCHTIAHRKNPPYTVEEIREMIKQNGGENGN